MMPNYSSAYVRVEKTRALTKGQVSLTEKRERTRMRQGLTEMLGMQDEILQNWPVLSPIARANLRERRGASGGG